MSYLVDLLGPRRAFEGGLFLPEQKSVTARRPIETLGVTGTLRVPLTVRRDLPTVPAVVVGDCVLQGQRLSCSASRDAVPVHAPVSGRIVELGRVWTAPDGYLPCVTLEPDGRNEAVPQIQSWEDESFIVQLAEKGVMCSRPRAPLHVVVQEAVAAGATDLIVNAMETEPYLTADLRTLVEAPGRLIDATCELADALGVSRAILALPFRHRHVVKRLQSEAHARHIEIAPLANPYPQCDPVMLVRALLEREVSPGGTVLDEGAVVLPLSAVRHAADALLDDRPMTHTVMAVAGDAVDRSGTYRVAVGTPIRRLAEQVGLVAPVAKAVCGGPLTGITIEREDTVITAETTALLLFATAPLAKPVPCVHCGWCVEDCPVGLDPSAMMRLESKPAFTDTELSHVRACVDCALCSYVCPSELPLAQTIVRLRTQAEGERSSPQGIRRVGSPIVSGAVAS